VTGAFATTGAAAAAPGETPTDPTWPDPEEPDTSWSPLLVPPDPPEAVAPEPPVCAASPPLFGDSTVIGAFAVTGALPATLGETPTEPTCAEPDEPVVSWSPLVVVPSPVEADAPPPPDCDASPPDPESSSAAAPASPPLSGEATVIGALAVTGASAAALGDVPTSLTWAAPDEPVVSWSPPEVDVPPAEAEAPEPPDCEASPPLFGEATVIGALAVTGAFAAAAGATSVVPTWRQPERRGSHRTSSSNHLDVSLPSNLR
jgi:hypothetical protein